MGKALVTGGTSGFGLLLVEKFANGSKGIGRANGWDLKRHENLPAIADESIHYDIFVNFAYLGNFQQTEILQAVARRWMETRKSGLIVNFGTYKTYCNRQARSDYTVAKAALDEASRQWSKLGDSGEALFRVSNLRLGYLDMPKNLGKPFYPGNGISAGTLVGLISRIFDDTRLSYPEVVLNIRNV